MSLRTALQKRNEFEFMMCLLFPLKFPIETSACNFLWPETCVCVSIIRDYVCFFCCQSLCSFKYTSTSGRSKL